MPDTLPLIDCYTRASRIAVLEANRPCKRLPLLPAEWGGDGKRISGLFAIVYVMRGFPRDYITEYPSTAYDEAIRILDEARKSMAQNGMAWNGYHA